MREDTFHWRTVLTLLRAEPGFLVPAAPGLFHAGRVVYNRVVWEAGLELRSIAAAVES